MSAILNYILDQNDKPKKEEPMILAFKPQFVEPILLGTKIHTIRQAKKDRWIPGRKIHFSTGVRTKSYHCFKEGECISTQLLSMEIQHLNMIIKIDGRVLKESEELELAINDGFADIHHFAEWFYPIVKESPFGIQFFTLIHWTAKMY